MAWIEVNGNIISEGAYTNLQRANIEYDFMRGVLLDEICETYGITRRTLRHLYQRWNMRPEERRRRRNEKIIRECLQGFTTKEVGAKYGLSPHTVAEICRIAGHSLKVKRIGRNIKANYNWRQSVDAFWTERKNRNGKNG